MNENIKRKFRGFTLVELIVAIAVISIMTAVTIVSMGEYKTKQEVEGAARQVAAAIREAQNYALTGKSITGNSSCRFLVSAMANSGSYSLQQTDSSNCDTVAGKVEYSLQNGVIFSATTEVQFAVPRAEPRNSAGTEIGTSGVTHVDFSVSKSGSTAHVCVYPLGRVDEKPAGATGSEPQCV